MIISAEDPASSANYVVCDGLGQLLPCVRFYDTDTREIEMALVVAFEETDEGTKFRLAMNKEKKALTVRFVMPDSYALDREGNKI